MPNIIVAYTFFIYFVCISAVFHTCFRILSLYKYLSTRIQNEPLKVVGRTNHSLPSNLISYYPSFMNIRKRICNEIEKLTFEVDRNTLGRRSINKFSTVC